MPSRSYSSPITLDMEKASADDLESLKALTKTESGSPPVKRSGNSCRQLKANLGLISNCWCAPSCSKLCAFVARPSGWQYKHTASVAYSPRLLCSVTACNSLQHGAHVIPSAVCFAAQRRQDSSPHLLSALERGTAETSCEIASLQGAVLSVHQEPSSSLSSPATRSCLQAALAWIGCFLSILSVGAIFGAITRHFSVPLMLASFGPTAALLYGSPSLPTAQPWNAMGKLAASLSLFTC